MFIDRENTWIGGNSQKDTNILKFTKSRKFLLQIGHQGQTGGSNDRENLNRPCGFVVYPKTNQVFVADGYGNRGDRYRDLQTSLGSVRQKPDDDAPRTRIYESPGPQQFNTVHAIRISNDDLVDVDDRVNNRAGSPARRHIRYRRLPRSENQRRRGNHIRFRLFTRSTAAVFLLPDGTNKKEILNRNTLEVLGFFGGHEGHGPAQFHHTHSMATDSKGSIDLAESFGQRVLRLNYQGMPK